MVSKAKLTRAALLPSRAQDKLSSEDIPSIGDISIRTNADLLQELK